MTPFWLSLSVGCALSAALGFTFVRFAVPSLPKFRAVDPKSIPVWRQMPGSKRDPEPLYAVASPVRERPVPPRALPHEPSPPAVARPTRPHTTRSEPPAKRRAAAPRMPKPTSPEPDAAKLALWARQIKAGERKMSVATDGCRVTWDRTCKHGHPTWLIRFGHLKPPRPKVERHRAR